MNHCIVQRGEMKTKREREKIKKKLLQTKVTMVDIMPDSL